MTDARATPNVSALRGAKRTLAKVLLLLSMPLLSIAACKSAPPAPPPTNEAHASAPRLQQRAAIYEKPAPAPAPDAGAVAVAVADDSATLPVPVTDYVALDAVPDAGGLRGRVVWEGALPSLPPEVVSKDPRVCGETKAAGRLVVDAASKGVAGALVWLADVRRGRKLDTSARASLGRKGCEFVPHMQVAALGSTLDLHNDDPVLHNAHAYLGVSTLFNVGFTTPGQRWHKPLVRTGLVEVKNDAGHPFMTAYVMVAEHPYYAVTDARGGFALDGVPAGEYVLKMWHEGWRVVATNPEGRAEYEAPRGAARRVTITRAAVADVGFFSLN